MSKLDTMKGLRAGAIYAAARIAPTTARSWNLQLGTAKAEGHPTYDVTDVVAAILMRQLTGEMGMQAAPACLIVDALRPYLPDLLELILDEHEREGRWNWDAGPFAIVRSRPLAPQNGGEWLVIVEAEYLAAALIDQSGGLSPHVIALRRIVNKAIYSLQRVLAGDLNEND